MNAYHSLQAFKDETRLLAEIPIVEKERADPFDALDYYGAIVPGHQRELSVVVLEGSENCLKSEAAGPPLNFTEPGATTAPAHVYRAADRDAKNE